MIAAELAWRASIATAYNHFLRDHRPNLCWRLIGITPSVQMSTRRCGLRKIEQAVLKRQSARALTSLAASGRSRPATVTVIVAGRRSACSRTRFGRHRGARYCAAVRGLTITTREALSNLLRPAHGRGFDMRFASRSNGTWMRKSGVRRKVTRPSCRLHRPGLEHCLKPSKRIRE